MNWKTFFIKFFRNFVISVVLCVVVLGLFGYLLGGMDGLVNMAYFGLALGLLGGFSFGIGMIFQSKFWGSEGNYKFLPEWTLFMKKSEDENKRSDY